MVWHREASLCLSVCLSPSLLSWEEDQGLVLLGWQVVSPWVWWGGGLGCQSAWQRCFLILSLALELAPLLGLEVITHFLPSGPLSLGNLHGEAPRLVPSIPGPSSPGTNR